MDVFDTNSITFSSTTATFSAQQAAYSSAGVITGNITVTSYLSGSSTSTGQSVTISQLGVPYGDSFLLKNGSNTVNFTITSNQQANGAEGSLIVNAGDYLINETVADLNNDEVQRTIFGSLDTGTQLFSGTYTATLIFTQGTFR